MKRLCLYIFLLVSLLPLEGSERDWDFEYLSQHGYRFSIGPVTVEQAKQAIINWAGRQNLQIELEPPRYWMWPEEGRGPASGIGAEVSNSLGEYISWYRFGVDDPNPDQKYRGSVYVDSYTGEVKGIFKGFGVVRENGTIADMLPPQQALNLAKQLIASYFPNFPIGSAEIYFISPNLITPDGSTLEEYSDDLLFSSSWEEYSDDILFGFWVTLTIPSGEKVIVGVQSAHIIIDSCTGELLEIVCCYEPLEVSPIPSLSREELFQAVASFFYGLGAQEVVIPDTGAMWRIMRPEPYEPQRLCFHKLIYIAGVPNLPDDIYDCWVDAHTGEVFHAGPFGHLVGGPTVPSSKTPTSFTLFFNGMKKELKSKPIFKDGKPYISLEDVKSWGFKLEKRGKGLTISYKGKKANLAKKELLKEGKRMYLKAEALGKMKGVIYRYIKDRNEVHILIVNEKAFQKGQEMRGKLMKKEG